MGHLSSDIPDVQPKNTIDHLELVKADETLDSQSEEASWSRPYNPRDTRTWPVWKQNVIILMVSFHSMSSTFMAAGIVPAASIFAESYGVSLAQASYLVSVQIVLLGVSPIFWIVLTERYGRHHILIFSVLAAMICNLGGAWCTTYTGQMITRALCAVVISPPIGIGSAIVAELTAQSQRARKLGWWVLMTILGTPAGPFIMGFVVQHTTVLWIFWIYAIVNFLQAVFYVVFGGETLCSAEHVPHTVEQQGSRSCLSALVPKRLDARPIKLQDFLSPFQLATNYRILIAALATAITFCYGNIVFVVEMPLTFGEKFDLNAQETGYQFVSVIVGCLIGEQISGPMSDYFMKVYAKKTGHIHPANRLWLTYIGFLTIIAGLLVWGFQLEKATSWNITPCVGIAIASFGNQIQSTILTAYAVDTCPERSASIGVFFNVVRLLYGFAGPFYFPYMFEALNFAGAAGVMCGIVAACGILPVVIVQITSGFSKSSDQC